jgi:hypothetical protein
MSTHIAYAWFDMDHIQVSRRRTTHSELFGTRSRGSTEKAYPAFARPTGFACYEGNTLALRHILYLSMPTVLMCSRLRWA